MDQNHQSLNPGIFSTFLTMVVTLLDTAERDKKRQKDRFIIKKNMIYAGEKNAASCPEKQKGTQKLIRRYESFITEIEDTITLRYTNKLT